MAQTVVSVERVIKAPPVVLESTHAATLEWEKLDDLREHAL